MYRIELMCLNAMYVSDVEVCADLFSTYNMSVSHNAPVSLKFYS